MLWNVVQSVMSCAATLYSAIIAATAGQNLNLTGALLCGLTVDRTDFQGFDH